MRASLRFVASLLALAMIVFTCANPVRAQVTLVGAGATFNGGAVTGATSFLDTTNFSWKNTADPAKVVQVDASNVTTGNTAVALYFAGTAAVPELWIGTSTAAQKVKIKHDGTDGHIATGAGSLFLEPTSNATIFGASTAAYSSNTKSFIVGNDHCYTWSSTGVYSGTVDTFLCRGGAAATTQLGQNASGSNTAAVQQILQPAMSTGNAVPGAVTINRGLAAASSSTVQSAANAFVPCGSKTLSNTSATATAIANVAVASNSSAAARVTVSVQCTNGTEYASSISTSYQGFANKAGTIAFGTAQNSTEANGASTAGTLNCTVVPTWVANGNSVDFKVTPVITGTATTTTAYVNVENLGAGVVSCK